MHCFPPLGTKSARKILAWRYEQPYTLYNIVVEPETMDSFIAVLIDPQSRFYGIKDPNGILLGLCCFGVEAQVPGGNYSFAALDVGIGMRPDLTGQGRGHLVIAAMLDFARTQFHPTHFRVTIAAFNQRSQRAFAKVGFQPTDRSFRASDGLEFLILVCSVDRMMKTLV